MTKLFYKRLEETFTPKLCSFVPHSHIFKRCSLLLFADKKHDSFHTVNKKKSVGCPTDSNPTEEGKKEIQST